MIQHPLEKDEVFRDRVAKRFWFLHDTALRGIVVARVLTKEDDRFRRAGLLAFFLSGICSISSGVVVSILREHFGFSYSLTGTFLSLLSIGNMAAGFLTGIFTEKAGMKKTVLTMALGYALGYGMMAVSGIPGVLMLAFLLAGFGKGNAINTCTVLVGNHSRERARGMSLMHASYALGALLCPFLISSLEGFSWNLPILAIAGVGLCMWLVFFAARLPGISTDASGTRQKADHSFLRDGTFWILTALVFCQNAAEQSVNGWLVTYFKDEQILTGSLASYTVTVMWGATLIARLLLAFVFKIKNIFKVLTIMGLGCTILYLVLMQSATPVAAILALFAFAFAMAGVNPLAVAGVGEQMSALSVGILLPMGGIGAIVMPMIIGFVADSFGLHAGMAMNLLPCIGMLVLSLVMFLRGRRAGTAAA